MEKILRNQVLVFFGLTPQCDEQNKNSHLDEIKWLEKSLANLNAINLYSPFQKQYANNSN